MNHFKKIDKDNTALILEDLKPHLSDVSFTEDETQMLMQELDFYSGYALLDIMSLSHNSPIQRAIVYNKTTKHTVVLDSTNEPIYELNQKAPIVLTPANITAYVQFFFSNVQGKHGRFLVTETVDDLRWREDPPPAARRAIANMLLPVQLTGKNEDGSYDVMMTLMFKGALYKSHAHIEKNGIINLFNEEILIEDMPVLDDRLGF
jgi:hypothetical protein